jgi:hypothetical protein
MKNLIFTTLLATSAVGVSAQAIFDDDYWGGVPTNNNATYQADVIGDADVFDLTGFNFVTGPDDALEIRIYGNYFDNIMSGQDLLSTDMGDLFISTDGLGWDTGGAATLDDYFDDPDDSNDPATTTIWEYAVVLSPDSNATGALANFANDTKPNAEEAISASVYNVDPDNIVLSSVGNGIYRANQEVSYDGSGQDALDTASWYISDDYSFLGITLDDPASLFGNNDTIGFHWTMSCGNDVIEFEYANSFATPVPEPSHIGALGIASILGLIAVRRRLKARKG